MKTFVKVVTLLLLVAVWQEHQATALNPREVRKASDGIKQRPEFKNVHDLIDKYLQQLIPLTDVTILIPVGIAQLYAYTSDQQTTIISYNTITTRYLYRNFTKMKGGASLDSLEGSTITKRGPNYQPVVGFQGTGATLWSMLIIPNLWVGSDFTIQGTTTLLIPADL
ncbi:unnamed protein product [Closterium sp. NIES-65]|nr:unnamed protein product [Closterium sp. NIES-65]